ncbi:MAG TPA: ATP-dependent endonuclease, partial [Tepidisphaeraceae bacterium]|nr:ATP-dependent endonuclease [Tepidisphaeraceae bacterium]
MRIKSVKIEHFRSIHSETFPFASLTAIVGPNGCGKSAVLRAIQLFYEPSPSATVDDFYNRDINEPIKISITFAELTPGESALYGKYVQDSILTITKVIVPGAEKYHGTSLQHRGFDEPRAIVNKTDRRTAYNALRDRKEYANLAKVSTADQADAELEKWEASHLDQCERTPDTGQFFGFRNVGQARLERFTRYVFVPAVREAEKDASDTKGSAIFQLLELVVRSALAQNEKFAEFKDKLQSDYQALIGPTTQVQLGELSQRLTRNLQTYVPAASIKLEWQAADSLIVPLPKATVKLSEDGFEAPVDRVGHGLQRAFILSLLQGLVSAQLTVVPPADGSKRTLADNVEPVPTLILGIEEPELYQHPNRQRHLSRILANLSSGSIPGVLNNTQVLYCTHSPLFIDLERFGSIRRLIKVDHQTALPKKTKMYSSSMELVAAQLQKAQDDCDSPDFTASSVRARMQSLMTPWMNEGFFADVVVLVEGEDDRATIIGAAQRQQIDLEAIGVAVIPCGGKDSMDRPFLLFSGLGIPVFLVFDGDTNQNDPKDRDKSAKANRCLQRLLGISEVQDFPATGVFTRHAVFASNLNQLVREAVGEAKYQLIGG